MRYALILMLLCGPIQAASEIRAFEPGATTCYAVVRETDGDVWYVSGQVFEAWGTGGRTAADYDIALTNKTGGMFVGDFDTNISSGSYYVVTHYQTGGSPADTDPAVFQEYGEWDGASWGASVATNVNVTQISGDSTAADNLESMYDGTGYIAQSAPASRDMIAALSGGLTQKVAAESSTVTQGTETNTYTSTATHDDVYYDVTDSGAGVGIDYYLQFDIGDNATPVEFHLHGYYDEGAGATNGLYIQAYNYTTAAWQTVVNLSNSTADQEWEVPLVAQNQNEDHEVRIRFVQDAQENNSVMRIDHASVGYVSSPVTAAAMADAVWDEAVADHTGELTFGGEVGGLDPNIAAIKAVTDLLIALQTTVASPNDSNNFTITAGTDVNDVYTGATISVQDADDSHWETRTILTYQVGRDVTVDLDFAFTPAAGDVVVIWNQSYLSALLLEALPIDPIMDFLYIDRRE